MTSFRRVENGWYAGRPSAESKHWAQVRMAELNASMDNTRVWTDAIWAGELAEIAVHRFLTERGIEHEWNNGWTGERLRTGGADIYLDGVGVGVKCATFRGRVTSGVSVLVPAQHRQRDTESYFIFCAYERCEPERLVILGGKKRAAFFAAARPLGVGERLGRLMVKNPCYALPSRELGSVDGFINAARKGRKPAPVAG